RHVEELLGRAREAVDLVDEEHLALLERGQHGREVARVLDRRPGRDAQRRAELRRDDHGERRLAEPGRPGQEHVVGRAAARERGLEDERELVAHDGLADELLEAARAQRRLGRALEVVRARRDDALGRERPVSPEVADAHLVEGRHAQPLGPPSTRGAARSAPPTSGASTMSTPASASTVATASSAALRFQPRPTRASTTWSRRSSTRRGAPDAAAPGSGASAPVGGPSLSPSSSAMRWAPFLPIPGTRTSAAMSPPATARRSASGVWTASIASARRGPTPLTVCTVSDTARSSSSAQP